MSANAKWDELIIGPTLVTMTEDGYGLIENGAIGMRDGVITFVGNADGVPGEPDALAGHVSFRKGIITPGLIDCHTHLVFAGDRAKEFAMRLEGATYEDIAKAGGGILSTVRATRAASDDELLASSMPRALNLLHDGVTTVEIKSGYGLDLDSERKMLRIARQIGELTGQDVRATYLGAHALPAEFKDDADGYIDRVIAWLQPLHEEGLVDAVDGFCEGIGFTPAQTRKVFDEARRLNIRVKLHADQLSDLGGAGIVSDYAGLSADHIEYTNEEDVAKMAANNVVAVLLPGAYHVLRETKQPPMAALRTHKVKMAVATDCNPGTSPLVSLRLAMQMATTHFRMTPLEALQGTTIHAAAALGLSDRGVLQEGLKADLVHWNLDHPDQLSYWVGGDYVQDVFINGRSVHRREQAPLI